jgi:hypothetical protein
MAVRHGADEALSPRRPAARAGHVGRRPGLVDEDQAGRVKQRLSLPPKRARRGDVGPVLLGGVRGFFLKLIPWRLKKRQTAP